MRSTLALALSAAITISPCQAADLPVAPPPQSPVPVEDLKKGLMTALGDEFEFVDGEVGRTRAKVGSWAAERFWFAKVRPKKAGRYSVGYTIQFDFGDLPQKSGIKKNWSDSAEYLLPFETAEKSTPRLVARGGYATPAYPLATVGDTIIIPIHVDRFRTNHVFFRPEPGTPHVKAFFNVAGEPTHERYLKLNGDIPVVSDGTGEHVAVLSSWGNSITNRVGDATRHTLFAYVEFAKTGEYNLAGRPVAAAENLAGEGTAFRVFGKDDPITVGLDYFVYLERTGKSTTHMSGHVNFGTTVVRVGDSALIDCSGTTGLTREANRKDPHAGIVVTRPFQPSESYVPESRK